MSTKDILASQGLSMDKPFGVTMLVCDHSYGVVDQVISVTEGAATADEMVFKYQWLCDAIMESLNGKNESGSGGVFREMGEMFQKAYDENKGDLGKTLEAFTAAKKKQGQGKPKKAK